MFIWNTVNPLMHYILDVKSNMIFQVIQFKDFINMFDL